MLGIGPYKCYTHSAGIPELLQTSRISSKKTFLLEKQKKKGCRRCKFLRVFLH